MKRRIAAFMCRVGGWKVTGQVPPVPRYVVIGVPHTSNWDFLIFIMATWYLGMEARFLAKASLFRWPFGAALRRFGGIAVQRDGHGSIVDNAAALLRGAESMAMVIAPEGTRSKAAHWRSGFYRIAAAARVPVVAAYVDGDTKTIHVGPAVFVGGHPASDMDTFRQLVGHVRGLKPGNETPVRLAEES